MKTWFQENRYNLIFVSLGLLLISISMLFMESNRRPLQKSFGAQLILHEGPAILHRSTLTKQKLSEPTSWMFDKDTIETGPASDLSLRLDGLTVLRIAENSLISLSIEGEKSILMIKKGNVSIESFDYSSPIWIALQGQRYTLSQYAEFLKNPSQNFGKTEATTLPEIAPSPALKKDKPEFSFEYIQSTLQAYQKNFQKCYTLALQKDRSAKGGSTLKFEIAENGSVSKAQIIYNTVQVSGFNTCLLEALQRVPFRSHQGKPVHAILPLTFE